MARPHTSLDPKAFFDRSLLTCERDSYVTWKDMGSAHALPLSRLGEYELIRLISTGATSEIYEARRVGPHGFTRRVAIKRVLPQLASDMRFVHMFCDEARVHAALNHPNLVAVVDFGEHGGELYMAMEYVDGTSLSEVMGLPNERTRVPLAPALRIAREVLSGLAHVHAASDSEGSPLGLVHREVAPENVLLGTSGEVKLTDFGIVRSVAAESRTLPGELRGALGYISPEQAMGARVDARSDLFSVGVILAEMLIGAPLFAGRTELEVLTQLHAGDLRALEAGGKHLPREVHGCLRRFLAQRPMERMSDAGEAVIEIDRLVTALNAFFGRAELVEYLARQGALPLTSSTRMKVVPPATASSSPASRSSDSEIDASYRVRRPQSTVAGPFRLARVLEMVASGRAGLDCEVSRDGGPFFPVSSVAELGHVAARPAYRFFDPVALIATERHPVGPGVTARQVFATARQRATGLLCLRSGPVQRRFYFVDGALVASSSTECDELLGRILVERNVIPPDAFDRELERGALRGRPLGAALVDAGLIGERELASAFRAQCLRRLSRAFSSTSGDLFFIKDARSGETERPIDPPPNKHTLVEAIRVGVTDEQTQAVLVPAAKEALVLCAQHESLFTELGLAREEIMVLVRVAELGAIEPLLREIPPDSRIFAIRSLFIGLVSGALRRKRAR